MEWVPGSTSQREILQTQIERSLIFCRLLKSEPNHLMDMVARIDSELISFLPDTQQGTVPGHRVAQHMSIVVWSCQRASQVGSWRVVAT